ncbi:MAG TPA: pilus assembly protein TadD, partial [Phenylobacterium sp.]
KVRQNLALVLGLQGRYDEAERLARQDLPPELVANNMAYLRSVTGGGGTGASRNWDAMRQPQ